MTERVDILGVGVSAIDMGLAVETITRWIETREPHYVCVTGVHGVMESQDDERLRAIHNAAGLVTPDGMPLVWISRWRGHRHVRRVYGPDLMLAVCAASVERGWRHFFYGGGEGTPELLADRLRERFPGILVAGTYSPPFRALSEDEDADIVRRIDAAAADIVWVGLSTPKQERWMSEHVRRLAAPVLVGVGAAFDFHAGLKRQAPRWMQRAGLEWLFRMASEPKRLGPRYAVNNPRFVWRILKSAARKPRRDTPPRTFKRFPPGRGELLVPTASRREALAALALYPACRPSASRVQRAARAIVRLAGPRALPGAITSWTPPLPAEAWARLEAAWRSAIGPWDGLAVLGRAQSERDGVALLLLRLGQPVAFVKLRRDAGPLDRERAALDLVRDAMPRSFRAPQVRAHGTEEGWSWLATSTLRPGLHRRPDRPGLEVITREVETALARLPRPAETPAGWRPMHGDFTPWNLRRAGEELWLLDWEGAGWGPPGADLVLYAAAEAALTGRLSGDAPAPESADAVAYWRSRVMEQKRDGRDRRLAARLAAALGRMATVWLIALLLGACQSAAPGPLDPNPGPGPPPGGEPRHIVFLLDHPATPNPSERLIRDRIPVLAPGVPLVLVDDDAFVPADTIGCLVIVMSKTVEDSLIRDQLKRCPCGIFFWEENQQMLGMLATVNNDGTDGAFWHEPGQGIWVRPEAPGTFRDGLTGSISFYDREAEMSYGKRQDVPAHATVVAEFAAAGGHKVIYALDRGQPLADGTSSAGRRFFFGLHRDTFVHLTPEALRLFDAGFRWTMGP
jgi:N-acetylglucosaminyldiphosphoundecaprenol N-acetyl-beta-D-mannosaminyltransferase